MQPATRSRLVGAVVAEHRQPCARGVLRVHDARAAEEPGAGGEVAARRERAARARRPVMAAAALMRAVGAASDGAPGERERGDRAGGGESAVSRGVVRGRRRREVPRGAGFERQRRNQTVHPDVKCAWLRVLVLGCGGRICTSGARPGYGRVRGWRPRRALLSEGHAGPRRSCSGRERVGLTNVSRGGSCRHVDRGWLVGARGYARGRLIVQSQPSALAERSARSAPSNQRGRVWSGAPTASAHRRQPVITGPSPDRVVGVNRECVSTGASRPRPEGVPLTHARSVWSAVTPPRSGDPSAAPTHRPRCRPRGSGCGREREPERRALALDALEAHRRPRGRR